MLLVTENFPQPTLRAIAENRASHCLGRCNHTHPRGLSDERSRRRSIAFFPPNGEGPAVNSATLLAYGADFALTAQVLIGSKTHGPLERVHGIALALARAC